jgi:hypothetical protein
VPRRPITLNNATKNLLANGEEEEKKLPLQRAAECNSKGKWGQDARIFERISIN